MLIVQWIMIPFALGVAAWEILAFLRTAKRLRLLHSMIWCLFAVAVWNPNFVQQIADFANVGRGTDFVLYSLVVCSLLFAFYVLRLFERQRRQTTLLIRELAIQEERVNRLTENHSQ